MKNGAGDENIANGREGAETVPFVAKGPFKLNPAFNTVDFGDDVCFKVTEKQMNDFQAMSPEIQTQLVKTALRVCLMKGGRNEVINRASDIGAALGALDTSYKKAVPAVLAKTQTVLEKHFGLGLISEGGLTGVESPNDGKLYMFNLLKAPRLAAVLAEHDPDKPFKGFAFIVMHIIWSSPGRVVSQENMLKELRNVDHRFPTNVGKNAGVRDKQAAVAIAELGQDFLGLMGRCKKEGYVVQSRAEGSNKDDENSVLYSLGSRFFAEVGKEALVESYYAALGQDVDEAVMEEVRDEDERLLKKKKKSLVEKENNTATGRKKAKIAAEAAIEAEEIAGGGSGVGVPQTSNAANVGNDEGEDEEEFNPDEDAPGKAKKKKAPAKKKRKNEI